jgi:hypothetical protein
MITAKIADGTLFLSGIPFVDEIVAINPRERVIAVIAPPGCEYACWQDSQLTIVGASGWLDYLVIRPWWFPLLAFSLSNGLVFSLGWAHEDGSSYGFGLQVRRV